MATINSRVYFNVTDGSILYISEEGQGDVIRLSVDEQTARVDVLKTLDRTTFDVIELQYGQLAQISTTGSITSVDLATKEVIITPFPAQAHL